MDNMEDDKKKVKKPKIKIKQFEKTVVYKRVIRTGKILEVYEYEKPIIKSSDKMRKGRANSLYTSDETKVNNRNKIASRARASVRRYANANPQLNKFLTLTFKENITDLDFAHYEFDKFIKRVKTRVKGVQYIAVLEFQKRGAIHFHLLCNFPYMPVEEIAKLWGNGFVRINRIDNVDNVGAYITKYMSKDNLDERLQGRKCYTMSKGLHAPEVYMYEEEVEQIMENLENVIRVHSSEYETEHYGKVRYTQIVCSEVVPKPNRIAHWLRFLHRFRKFLVPLPDDTPCPF